MNHPLYITGLCPQSGKPLVGGIFQMHDRVGFPVDCCIDECKERGLLIDWMEALCDCWLNDCLKYDSFVRQVRSQIDLDLDRMFLETNAATLLTFPKMQRTTSPLDTACRYLLAKKKLLCRPTAATLLEVIPFSVLS